MEKNVVNSNLNGPVTGKARVMCENGGYEVSGEFYLITSNSKYKLSGILGIDLSNKIDWKFNGWAESISNPGNFENLVGKVTSPSIQLTPDSRYVIFKGLFFQTITNVPIVPSIE